MKNSKGKEIRQIKRISHTNQVRRVPYGKYIVAVLEHY